MTASPPPPTDREALALQARSQLRELSVLSHQATAGDWYHYDQVFRAQFSRRRVTEIQRAKDGEPIISWGGFDGLSPAMVKKRNHNARFIVALVKAFRSGWFKQILTELAQAHATISDLRGQLAAAEGRDAGPSHREGDA